LRLNIPDLSVVVTVVEAGPALRRCLKALSNQDRPPVLEIIVPYDDTIPEVGYLKNEFPIVRFLDLGSLHKKGAPQNEFSRHVLYDRRRAAGLRAAGGRLLALLEDRGRPRSDWARSMVELHDSTTYSVIGGAIENGAAGSLRWAIFFCDFGRYQAPLEQENPEYVTDVNICYKREALESVRELWEQRYQEPTVNFGLQRRGHGLYLSDRPVVIQERANLSLWSSLQERIHWGRTFGRIRGSEISRSQCLALAASTPFVPILLFIRHLRRQLQKQRHVGKFVRAIPAMLLLLHFWALGEFVGYCETTLATPKHPNR
jgi:hypothetical protein